MYLNFNKFELTFDRTEGLVTIARKPYRKLLTLRADGGLPVTEVSENTSTHARVLCIVCGEAKLWIRLMLDRVSVKAEGLAFSGTVGLGEEPFAVSENAAGHAVRAASGPAVASDTDALYDRAYDSLLSFTGIRLYYDWDAACYAFGQATEAEFVFREAYYQRRYELPAPPKGKKVPQYPTPPVGWMTWYSVKFDASEERVLENARWLRDNLAAYGADTIWVDWEWYHSNLKGFDDTGCNVFEPRTAQYPHGMKYVADEIRKLGLVPAIWVGASNDVNQNRMFRDNPDWVIANDRRWCGQWWVDPTNPRVLNEYIPAVFEQLIGWGYEAIKWDCMGMTQSVLDVYHDRFSDPSVSTDDAFRHMIEKAREVIGEDRYLLQCGAFNRRNLAFAAHCFDGARIGGDIFKWEEFISYCVDCVYDCYRFNNVLWYADPDNLVLRGEFNTLEQARSRLTFVALTGLPQTLGDDLPRLEEDRVALLKRALPAIDTHPMMLNGSVREGNVALVNLAVARRWENYNVVGVFNLGEEKTVYSLKLNELNIGFDGSVTVWDIWNEREIKAADGAVELELGPCGCLALAIHPDNGLPAVLSTSRHITAGAFDLLDVTADKTKLAGRSKVIPGKPYTLTVRTPSGIRTAEYLPQTDVLEWRFDF